MQNYLNTKYGFMISYTIFGLVYKYSFVVFPTASGLESEPKSESESASDIGYINLLLLLWSKQAAEMINRFLAAKYFEWRSH